MYGQSKIRIHAKTIERFKQRVRELTDRNCGKSLYQVVKELNMYLRGWWNYFRLAEARYMLKALKTWIIRRLRCLVWKQWKNPRTQGTQSGKTRHRPRARHDLRERSQEILAYE